MKYCDSLMDFAYLGRIESKRLFFKNLAYLKDWRFEGEDPFYSPRNFINFLDSAYYKALHSNSLLISPDRTEAAFKLPMIPTSYGQVWAHFILNTGGGEQEFFLNRLIECDKPYFGHVSRQQRSLMYEYAYFTDRNTWWQDLADKAEPEPWDYVAYPDQKGMLKSYLMYTFERLVHERKIVWSSNAGRISAFNTGLLSRDYQQPIYGVFERTNRQPMFKGWFQDGHPILSPLPYSPLMADYTEDLKEFSMDTSKDFKINAHHIFEDNQHRIIDIFPGGAATIPLNVMIEGTISYLKRRIERNPRFPIPQLYHNKVQYLLPFQMNREMPPQMVLIFDDDGNSYTARTCITLDMAYANARLLMSQQDSWLDPNPLEALEIV
ncbi:DUF3825 domain-containing protein [Desulfobaculum bizertense]|uniref:DUF3825 domain-containing protein n=1 Tax=Desulfobaculum bizertense DSM 18034 TaxID=1121442 RepID=A0A1T4WZ78_9BACT|nr:DUF3825 domain-containing protein [Desulfobaculum bizertense]SKA82467.1 protein of unknown function [Desulfobaculum bizertense DSM 18034]